MPAAAQKLTFAEHIQELRKRLMWSLLFVVIGAGVGYALHDRIIWLLQQPLGEQLYYTTPTGAFSFIIKVCCVFGFIVSLPVVTYQLFGFFEPLIPAKTRRSLLWYVLVSVLLATAGIAFAYLVSLPAALHFLVGFGSSAGDIHALITAEEYFNFVLAYIAGFAALFQLPLVITFINKITPLKPKRLLSGTRYVILGSFIVAALITPTPDPVNQALMAGPIILLYFMSVVVIAGLNVAARRKKPVGSVPELVLDGIEELLREDDSEPVLLEEKPRIVQVPVPARKAALPIRSTARRRSIDGVIPTARSLDMLPPVRTADTARPRSRPAPESIARTARPRVRMGLISDFIPVSE